MKNRSHARTKRRRGHALILCLVCALLTTLFPPLSGRAEAAEPPAGEKLLVEIGEYGEISSLKIENDLFPTEYVMNAEAAPEQDTADHQWLGELLFTYRLDQGEWRTASTNQSGDVRSIVRSGSEVTVMYAGSRNAGGIRDFKLTETYMTQEDGSLSWRIRVENTSGKRLEIGDYGVPLPFNEQWNYGDAIYETRVVTHSFVGSHSSYITAGRPSGLGSFLLMTPDASTGAAFEYQDRWRIEEHPGSKWAGENGKWTEGLNVFYIHSNVIKSTNRGYLPNTSLNLNAGESSLYGFKFFAVKDEAHMKQKLYEEGLIDVTVIPGMIVPTNQKARFDLRTQQPIHSVTDAEGRPVPQSDTRDGGHHIYEIQLSRLGPNPVTVQYGDGQRTVLQFYGIDPIDRALEAHSAFMVDKTQWQEPGSIRDKVFDDWMMHTKEKRGVFNGYWGWGDDWGLTHGQFLAEKNALVPVAREIKAVDEYLETAIWTNLMNGHHEDYLIHDFLMPEPNDTPTYRGYAYPHVYNTYFSMYKIAKAYPDLAEYKHEPGTYLLRAYRIMKALYEGPVAYNWETGLMGELTTPAIIQALESEGYAEEAGDIREKMLRKYVNFKNTTYPYGSEYSYDNTGEEAVYTLAKMQLGNQSEQAKAIGMMDKINRKTRASRGHMPVWYYYADPVTITGENWWNFQYTVSLAGYAMDDWIRYHAVSGREEEQRLSYAAKIANIGSINTGQISSEPENYGAAAWTFQAERGNLGTLGHGGGANVPLQNGWRGMTGEADLGLFGALQILSADVAVDPIFGLTGYGANVTEQGDAYVIEPTDGLFMKLNLITEKLYIALNRDQYTRAELSKEKNAVKLNMKSTTPASPHQTRITFEGLKQGAYEVKVDGVPAGQKLNAFGSRSVLTVNAPAAAAYTVELTETTPDPNRAPVLRAGEDRTVTLLEDVTLKGQLEDDGLPQGTVTTRWILASGPDGASAAFGSPSALTTSVRVDRAGVYTFRLEGNDSELTGHDTVVLTVNPEPPLPEVLAAYPFDENAGQSAADASLNGKDAVLAGSAGWTAGRSGSAVQVGGTNGHVKLPENIMAQTKAFTVAAWTRANKLSDYARLFDFGSGTDTYMFLAPKVGGNMQFSITTGGNRAGEEQSIDGPALTAGGWHHVAVTLSDNTGILYIDGREAGRNSSMTLSPRDLGKTKNNYIGKSQYPDPIYDGAVDDFRIYSRALSPAEIAGLLTPPVDQIAHLQEVQVSTPAGTEPKLPPSITAYLKDGSRIGVTVNWDAIHAEQYAQSGRTFSVHGTVTGTELAAAAKVTVTDRVIQPYPEPVLRYKLDEASGTSVKDETANQLNGTVHGKLAWLPGGHQGGSLLFDGDMGNYIDAGTSALLQPQDLTVSYWIKRTESMDARENVVLWFKPENDYAGKGFFITYNGNSSIVYVDGANGFYVRQSPDAFLPLNEWTHVVFTFDSSTGEAAIYRNGVPQAVGIDGHPVSISATGDVKKIGVSGYGNGAQLRAGLDDFRIYDGAMTASQVKSLYEGRDIASVLPVAVTTETGSAPDLPERVSVTYESGSTGAADVSWEAVDPARYAEEGTFTVKGTVEGTNLAAQAQVTVSRKDRTAPVTTAPGLPESWVNRDVLVTLQAEDEESGTAATYYSIDGGPVQPGTTVQIRGDGIHRLTYWSEDLAGNKEASHTAEVRIDKTAPELVIRLDHSLLKPANHKMTPVTASVYASDSLSSVASVVLTSIVSSEADNGQGDGDTANDIQQAEYGTADTRFLLRAERAGGGGGRTYTVTYTARDHAGNQTSSQAIVTVPHH